MFIPVAEQNGLIGRTDRHCCWINHLLACARWRGKRPDCWVAVNISPLLLDDPGLTDRIEQKLQ